ATRPLQKGSVTSLLQTAPVAVLNGKRSATGSLTVAARSGVGPKRSSRWRFGTEGDSTTLPPERRDQRPHREDSHRRECHRLAVMRVRSAFLVSKPSSFPRNVG